MRKYDWISDLFFKEREGITISDSSGSSATTTALPETIDRATFVGICRRQLGDSIRSVVIKLMKDQDQWRRERDARNDNDLDPKYVVRELTTSAQEQDA